MQILSRGLGLVLLLLLASSEPVLAMDQSAVEETNCLAACDANAENCMATGASAHKPYSPVKMTSREASSRRVTTFSQAGPGATSATKERAR